MGDAIAVYFGGEREAGLMLAVLGVMNVVCAGLLFAPRFGLRGLALTLVVWAVLQLAVGLGLYFRTGPQVSRLSEQLASQSAQFHAGETARMEKVQRNFVIIEYVWASLVILACAAALWWKNNPAISGVALGVLVNASVMLAFDTIAERRGQAYVDALTSSRAN